jgi:hypothetical protein
MEDGNFPSQRREAQSASPLATPGVHCILNRANSSTVKIAVISGARKFVDIQDYNRALKNAIGCLFAE